MLIAAASEPERQCHLVDGGSLTVERVETVFLTIFVYCLSLSLHRSNIPCEEPKACE